MSYALFQNKKILESLPKDWSLTSFKDSVTDITSGHGKIKKEDYLEHGEYPIIDQGKELVSGYYNDNLCIDIKPSYIIFGDHTRIFKYVNFDFILGADGVKVLVPNNNINTKYLYYFFLTLKIPNTGYNRHFKFLKDVTIPFPPLEQQKQIVAVLDKAQSLIEKRKEAIAKLDELVQAVFLDMFGDIRINSDNFLEVNIEKVVQKMTAGWSTGGEERIKSKGELGVLTTTAVTSGEFKDYAYKVAPIRKHDINKELVHPQKNSILVSRMNTRELVGASSIVEKDYNDLFLPDRLWRLTLDTSLVNPYYFINFIQNRFFRDRLSKLATGTSGSMLNISQKKFLNMDLLLPSKESQDNFSNIYVRIRLQKIDSNKQLKQLEDLFQSLLQCAFKGELTFNDKINA